MAPMSMPTKTVAASSSGLSAAADKDFWEKIVTTTPVVLTVVATLLAGLSSSEMTLAQYHRALAAQNQSKAGDQWNFFQAKRIRGTNLEMTVDLLHAVSDSAPVEAATFQSTADRVVNELHRASRAADGLPMQSGGALETVERFRKLAAAKTAEAEKLKQKIDEAVSRSEVQEGLAQLAAGRLPAVENHPVTDATLLEGLKAIDARQTEQEMTPLLVRVNDGELAAAIRNAEANARAFDDASKPVARAADQLDRLVNEQLALARSFQRAAGELKVAQADMPMSDGNGAVGPIEKSAAAARSAAEQLSNDFKAARHGYTARRYEREARYNQEAAALYELQVRKSSITAERHRARSKFFFYGMLLAQAGVTIASLSLAVRHKSLLWSLAGIAGLMALGLGVWVYWYM
jgi:hypothetical protein